MIKYFPPHTAVIKTSICEPLPPLWFTRPLVWFPTFVQNQNFSLSLKKFPPTKNYLFPPLKVSFCYKAKSPTTFSRSQRIFLSQQLRDAPFGSQNPGNTFPPKKVLVTSPLVTLSTPVKKFLIRFPCKRNDLNSIMGTPHKMFLNPLTWLLGAPFPNGKLSPP